MKPGKRRKSLDLVQRGNRYTLEEACGLVKETAFAKFDETVDLAVRLGVNPKHADQQVRGAVVLPHGTGSSKKVLVFAKGDKAAEATAAGADFVGTDDMSAKIQEGWLGFDVVVATPDCMGAVLKVARVLGPRGLMPNPKVGTVTMDVTKAVSEAKAGKVTFKLERKGAIIHVSVAKCSFDKKMINDNVTALVSALVKAKPASSKGTYLRSVTLSSTMGPGIRIDPNTISIEA